MNQTAQNTDLEIYRDGDGYYASSVFVTQFGGIGMDHAGQVVIKTIEEWIKLAIRGMMKDPTSPHHPI